jgi:LppP/LprE lipoprotein
VVCRNGIRRDAGHRSERRRVPARSLSVPLLGLALLAGCGAADRTAVVTRTTTVVHTVTVPAATTPADTSTAPASGTAPLTLRDAERTLDARGYSVLTERDFQPDQTLKVLIGIRRRPPRAEQAFLFAGSRFIGTDTAAPSGAIEVVEQGDDRVTLGYGLYRPGDALCCASGGVAKVTYRWTGAKLVPEGSIPSADPSASLSRR